MTWLDRHTQHTHRHTHTRRTRRAHMLLPPLPTFPFTFPVLPKLINPQFPLNQIQNTGRDLKFPFQETNQTKRKDSNTGPEANHHHNSPPTAYCRKGDGWVCVWLHRPEKSEDSGNTFLSFLCLMATSAMRCMWSEGKWYVGKPGTRFRYSISGGPSRDTTSSELLEYQM